jgi:Ca-activated chloride channel family protein
MYGCRAHARYYEMANYMMGIVWDTPEALWYFPILVALLALLCIMGWRSQTVIRQLADAKWQGMLLPGFSTFRLWIKKLLLAVGLFALFLTLLHPQWGKKETTVAQQGRDLFIALDVSRSMLATDLKPNRLAVAKSKIKQLIRQLKSERIGLILFSGAAVVQCPLTTDVSAFELFLDAVDAQTISSGTTAIDQVLIKTIEQFQNIPSKKNKLLVIFTDGEDFSRNLAELKAQARSIGLHIFTIGVATPEGAPVPKLDDKGNQIGYEKDDKGAVVISRLNEGILSTLAQDSGGQYFTQQADNDELNGLLSAVQKFEKEQWEERKISKYIERYPFFLGVSLICFALEWLL